MSAPTDRLNAALSGRYEIERELGEGGMATVYLAEDLKHHRKVALKVLKPELAAVVGAERFLAEIETTANLQHPHILPLFDSGEADSFLFYVMPFVEGESLRGKLDRERQLPVDEAVQVASDMAEALDYAHRHGVVHRDIKPANILMHEGRPLIADFGIALAVGAAGGTRLTETGLSVGTPFYMSPEQATGDLVVGAASDIYALSCVLYEMLVGEPPYVGATAQAVLGKIISGGPVSATEQRRSIPAHVDAAIRKALEKLAADRFGSAKDFAAALADPAFRHGEVAGAASSGGVWNRVSIGATVLAVAFATAFGWTVTRPSPIASVTRLSVRLPAGQEMAGNGTFDISADGRVVVYEGPAAGGSDGLWVRRLDELEGTFVRGSEFALSAALSPDGSEVAFRSDVLGLRVVSLESGAGRSVGDSISPPRVRWGPDGEWLYLNAGERIYRLPALGGPTELVAQLDTAQANNNYFDVLPTGEGAVVELTYDGVPAIHALDFSTGETTFLTAGQFPRYANGYLLFVSPDGTTLMAAPMDARRLELTGTAVSVVEGLRAPDVGWSFFAASHTGTLLYALGPPVGAEYQIVSVTRQGVVTAIDPEWSFDPGDNNRGLSLSPEGDRLAVTLFDDGNYDIWVKELPRGPLTRLSFQDGWDVRPRWAPDGRTVLYLSAFGGPADMRVVSKSAAGTGDPVQLMNHELPIFEALYTPDMQWLLGRTGGATTAPGGRDVWALQVGIDTVAGTLLVTDFDEKAIDLSPDGRWLLYESDETDRNEIYVRPFPNVDDDKVTVSTNGGVMPRWSRGGGEIFYVNADEEMMAATVETEPRFRVTNRTTLFALPPGTLFRTGEQYALYDTTLDDESFLLFQALQGTESENDFVIVQNWIEGLPGR